MCYLVTGINAARADTGGRAYTIHDTLEEAKSRAEQLIRSGFMEVSVWKQVTAPKLTTSIDWSDPVNQSH